ncbi:enhancer of polycomb-like-domain-containing protein [Syncephalis plumigaleata]|nr:enhancer of polycomb-like-domain-containing protein [Syncephalis plumigaleata]
MNKAKSFRSRKVDAKRPLPVYRASEIPDLDENLSAQRSVPLVDTGVEKDEETEHHLQAAISAANAANEVAQPVYIPTPDASRLVPEYEAISRPVFHRPHTYIRFSSTVEECGGSGYVMSDVDKKWLTNWQEEHGQTSTADGNATATGKIVLDDDLFEDIMDTLEDLADRQPGTLNKEYAELEALLKETALRPNIQHNNVVTALAEIPQEVEAIFGYWQSKRRARNGVSIMPQLKTEEQSQKESDPYVCFRRREVKPMRKTRRSDAQSLDKLRQLRSELYLAYNLLELVDRREKMRQESLALEQLCFDQKMIMRELRRKYNFKDESDGLYHVKKKLKKIETKHLHGNLSKQQRSAHGHTGSNAASLLSGEGDDTYARVNGITSAHDELFAKRIEEELQQRRQRDIGWYDITEDPHQPFPLSMAEQRFRTPNTTTGVQYRRRIGRGGRVYLDRRFTRPTTSVSTMYQDICDTTTPTSTWPLDQLTDERNRFDNDIDYDGWMTSGTDSILNEWKPSHSLLSYRASLLTESDIQQAKTKPWLITQPRYTNNSSSLFVTDSQYITHYNNQSSLLSSALTSSASSSLTQQRKSTLDSSSPMILDDTPTTAATMTAAIAATTTKSSNQINRRATASPANRDMKAASSKQQQKHTALSGPALSPSSPPRSSPDTTHTTSSNTAVGLTKSQSMTSLPSPSAIVNANRSMGALMLTTGDALARSIPNVHSPGTPQIPSRQSTVSPVGSPHINAKRTASSPLVQRLPVPPH